MRTLPTVLVVCSISVTGLAGQTAAPPPAARTAPSAQEFHVTAAGSEVELDGRLDESAWQSATAIPIRYEWFPGDSTPATIETTCLVTFDRSHLYVGFRAKDSHPGSIRANLADRDAPFQDDTVGFMLDTFNDGRRAFQFRINARGVQMDAFNSDVDGSEDWSWDAIWDARTVIAEDGYTVEVAIPFSSLRFPRTAGAQTWGFLAMRDVPRSTRVRLRSNYTDRNRTCLVCQFDKLTGFEAITPGKNIEFDPTFTVARTDVRDPFPAGSLQAGDADPQAGLSARWSVTPNVVFSGTINPDFYQVEADAAQLDVNTRFQLFFPEKRPFFLEGQDFFSTPIEAVFTRTVVDPRWGAKLSGKEGPHGFGFFSTQDDRTGITIPGYEGSGFQSLPQHNVGTVLRYRRDLGKAGSTLGALYTGRQSTEGESYSNRLGGIDGLFRLSGTNSIGAQWLASRTNYPGSIAEEFNQRVDPFTGQAYAFNYNHGSRHWQWGAQSNGASPEFRADSGFVPQVDIRVYRGNAGYTFLGSTDKWFNEIFIGGGADRTEDWHGERASWGCDFPIEYSGRWQMSVEYNPACNYEYYLGQRYTNFRHNFSWSIRPSGLFSLYFSSGIGGTIDFDNARKADQVRLSTGGTFNLLARIEGSVDYTRFALDVAPGRLFTANQAQTRILYHLSLKTFVRAIVQYTDIDRDPSLYTFPVTERSKRLFTQFLFSHKLNPQTVFLVGYSDNGVGTPTITVTKTDRTFFLKIGYAWVL
jgi:cellulose/xylan binding protein with CBM9 domain/uncharacterized protein DUF5916